MKKLIFLIPLLLTGCALNPDFSKTCSHTVNSKDVKYKETMLITYNHSDEIKKAVITRTYKGDEDTINSIKKSGDSYNNALLKKEGVKISISKDTLKNYEVKYYLDVSKVDNEVLDIFNLRKNSVKFFNHMNSQNITCKK